MKQKTAILLFILIFLTIGLSSCAIVVFDSSQLLSILNSMRYEYYPLPGGKLPTTEDIQIIGTVTISSEELEVPGECSNIDYCRPLVGFRDSYGAEGITITPLSDEPDSPYSLTLTNMKLRFRALVVNMGGPPPPPEIKYSKYPIIQLLPPSDYVCNETQIKCNEDKVCYDNYFSYCLHCLALSQEECVCRDENQIFDDGTNRMVVRGDDIIDHGKCQSGECVGDW